MQLRLRFCCGAVVVQPLVYRETGSAVVQWLHSLSSTGSQVFLSTILNGKAVLTEPVLCQGFSKVLISNHGLIVSHGVLLI